MVLYGGIYGCPPAPGTPWRGRIQVGIYLSGRQSPHVNTTAILQWLGRYQGPFCTFRPLLKLMFILLPWCNFPLTIGRNSVDELQCYVICVGLYLYLHCIKVEGGGGCLHSMLGVCR